MIETEVKLQPRPAPEPGYPFVNRKKELKLIEDKLSNARRGDHIAMNVVCFWGTFGIGKSWLLHELERCYRRSAQAGEESHPTAAVRLDMAPERVPVLWQGDKLDVRQVIYEFWKQLALQVGAHAQEPDQISAEEYARDFVQQVTNWSGSVTPILLLDTMDSVVHKDEQAFFWLEEHLVEPLALTERVLLVFASRGELRRWQRFQVRRKVDPCRLEAFSVRTAGREVQASTAISQILYRQTFGHPLATEYTGRLLQEQGMNLKTASVQEIEEALTPELMQMTLRHVTEQVFGQVPPLVSRLACDLSILRWVNEDALRKLVIDLGLDLGRGPLHDDPIGALQSYHLLYWDTELSSYTFAPTVRRLLARSLELDNPAEFSKAHCTAYRYHQEHLDKAPLLLAHYLPEAAYHYAMAGRSGALLADVQGFESWWQGFLSERAPAEGGPWKELARTVKNDVELKEVLSTEEYERLYVQARERAQAGSSKK